MKFYCKDCKSELILDKVIISNLAEIISSGQNVVYLIPPKYSEISRFICNKCNRNIGVLKDISVNCHNCKNRPQNTICGSCDNGTNWYMETVPETDEKEMLL